MGRRILAESGAEEIDQWLSNLDSVAIRDHRNGAGRRNLLSELGDAEGPAQPARLPGSVLKRYARRSPDEALRERPEMDPAPGGGVVGVRHRLQESEPRHLVEDDEEVVIESAARRDRVRNRDSEPDPPPYAFECLLGTDGEEVDVALGDIG